MNQRKTDFLNYLKHLSVTTLVHQQNFINKWYDLFSMLDENQYNSISMDHLTDAEYYIMNYSIPHVGSYKVYFNIDHVIQSDAYQTSSIQSMTEDELDRNRINHSIPFDMNIYLLNQFQSSQKNIKSIKYYPVITDSYMSNGLYTVIDGNHQLEMSLREQDLVELKYTPFYKLKKECYGNTFSYLLHHFMNEMHIISSDPQYLLNQYPLQETIRI